MNRNLYILLIAIATLLISVHSQRVDPKEVKCSVCKATVHEMEDAVSKVDPARTASVGGFRIDSEGNSVTKTVKLSKSELYLTELMENVCEKMDDYVKTTHKKTGRFALMQMLVDGKMNPHISDYDFIQDGDLNKSLKHYCLEILDESEEPFLKAFMSEKLQEDNDIRICSEQTHYCKDAPIQEDYNLEDVDEYSEYKSEL